MNERCLELIVRILKSRSAYCTAYQYIVVRKWHDAAKIRYSAFDSQVMHPTWPISPTVRY